MYGKVFESMYEGSLYGQWEALVTMQQLIVLANEDGVVDMTPPAIAGKTSIPLKIIEKGLGILSKPDPYSRTPDHDGTRIVLLDEHRPWGWYLVNYKKYRDMVRLEDKRKADRERIAAKRNSLNLGDVAECRIVSQPVANVAYTDTDTDIDIPPTEGAEAPSLNQQVWQLGTEVVGKSQGDRSFLGKLIKEHGEGSVLAALKATKSHGTGDPKSYLRGILREESAPVSDTGGLWK